MPRILIRPDGRKVEVADDKIKAALSANYREQTPAEYQASKAAEQPFDAFSEGVGRGLTVGGSDVAAAELGDDVGKIKARKEANPIVSTVGEVVGTAAGLVAPVGPVAAITKLGQGAKLAVGGGKLAGTVAAGAVEGTLFGLGAVVSENALGDTTTNAQKLSAMGASTLFGAGFNAATHGAGKLAGAAVTKVFGGKAMQDALEDLANKGLEVQLGQNIKGLRNKRNIYGKNADEIFEYAREKGLVSSGDTNESFFKKVTEHRKGVGEETGAILKDASERTPGFDVPALYSRVKSELLPALEKDPSNSGSVKWLVADMDDREALGPEGHNLESAWQLQSSLKKSIGFGEADGALKQNMDKFRSLLRDEIKQQANTASPHFGSMLDDTSNRYRLSKSLEEMAEAQFQKQQSNATFSLKDTLLGSAMLGPKGMALAVGSKMVRERGGFMLAAAADSLANSKTLERMAGGLRNTIEALSADGMLGVYRPTLEIAAARGTLDLLATHVQLARTDPKYLPTLGMMPEEGEAANQYAGRAERLELLAKSFEKQDSDTSDSVARFLRQKPGKHPAGTKSAPSMEDFEKRLNRITQVLTDPTLADTSDLAATAPALAMAASIQTQNMAGFLLSKAPKNPTQASPPSPSRGKCRRPSWASSTASWTQRSGLRTS